ncbi:hypothetical protein OS493_019797 [Desmophyllum pertusum]|uniref:Uncharacterized protein n=1 Tax=Desmophyllum pertusum TaxID=174260 RepID=A0A9W9YZL2_9CNID|nr:hypothetical protein OS493_019797 [Desmophyllum pertusum]
MEDNMTTQSGQSNMSRFLSFFKALKRWNSEQSTKKDELPPQDYEVVPTKADELFPDQAVELSSEPGVSPAPDGQVHHKESETPRRKTERERNESFISKRGIKLTAAAKELSDEKWNLLYEDIFKPLDVYAILHERRNNLSA